MERQRVKEDPLVEGIMCLFTLPSQAQVDVTFLNDYDEPELPEHEVQEPEDAHKKGKPCLILSRHDLFKTRSVQDTICSRHDLFKTRSVKTHFTMLVSVSHPMSTSPVRVIEYVAPASAVTYTEFSPVTEYVALTPADTLAARSPAIEHVVPTPVVFHATPATLIERSSL